MSHFGTTYSIEGCIKINDGRFNVYIISRIDSPSITIICMILCQSTVLQRYRAMNVRYCTPATSLNKPLNKEVTRKKKQRIEAQPDIYNMKYDWFRLF